MDRRPTNIKYHGHYKRFDTSTNNNDNNESSSFAFSRYQEQNKLYSIVSIDYLQQASRRRRDYVLILFVVGDIVLI